MKITSRFAQSIALSRTNFDFPTQYIEPDDNSNRAFMIEQNGKVIIFDKSNPQDKATALDLKDVTDFFKDWEGGLLGIELSPQFSVDNHVYLFYTQNDTSRHPSTDNCETCINSTISRFTMDPGDPDKIDPNSEMTLLEIPQFRSNHRGGQLNFGPDGMLYVNVGDALTGQSQFLDVLYGKILRIDVNTASNGKNYSIPVDNPFAGNTDGYREEIFAYGFRNPWRSSFDPNTGDHWVGDVGNFTWEEINIVENGKDYGWPMKEGPECVKTQPNCSGNFTEGILSYPHELDSSASLFDRLLGRSEDLDKPYGASIIGGHVYRGSNFPELIGKYVFADYTGGVWSLEFNAITKEVEEVNFVTRFPDSISSIAKTVDHELYFLGHTLGYIYELEYLSNLLITIAVLILVSVSVAMILATLWVWANFKRKGEPFEIKVNMRSILKRAALIAVILIALSILSFLLEGIFKAIARVF